MLRPSFRLWCSVLWLVVGRNMVALMLRRTIAVGCRRNDVVRGEAVTSVLRCWTS